MAPKNVEKPLKRKQSKENRDEKQASGENSPQKSNKGTNFTYNLPKIENA